MKITATYIDTYGPYLTFVGMVDNEPKDVVSVWCNAARQPAMVNSAVKFRGESVSDITFLMLDGSEFDGTKFDITYPADSDDE